MDGQVAIKCPDPGCDGMFPLSTMEEALTTDRRALRRLWVLRAESLMRKPLHCPYKDCSALMDAHEMDEDVPMECANCHRELCLSCKVPFHTGFSCAQFQALPQEHRSKEDVELLQLAVTEHWRRCGACGHMVERLPGGCNFLLCRCKHAFCYACGAGYVHTRATANNRHGQPGCGCGLFDAPPPEPAEPAEPAAAAVALMWQPLRMPQPPQHQHIVSLKKGRAQLRDGQRWVKHGPYGEWFPVGRNGCNKSRTHDGCPYGVCCWFQHRYDDM